MEQYLIIDAHSHLWERQDTVVDGQPIHSLECPSTGSGIINRSRSLFFDEERQMLPPFMIDGKNGAEVFLSNMDYAQVAASVVVQEVIDGNQDAYLAQVQKKWPNRFLCCGLIDESSLDGLRDEPLDSQFRAYAMPGHRIKRPLSDFMPIFKAMEKEGKILSMCLGDDERQINEFDEIVQECSQLKVAIGHIGMVTTKSWKSQILLARHPNVMIESGGITWLFNDEFYPYPTAVRCIKEAADMVGMEKLMWGSDYPRTITAITYRMSYDFILKSAELTETEKRLFLGENAKKFYGFTDLVELPYIKNMSE